MRDSLSIEGISKETREVKRPRKLTAGQFIRLEPEDVIGLHEAAEKLDLPLAEITRRCLRLGIPILKNIALPGCKPEREPSGTA